MAGYEDTGKVKLLTIKQFHQQHKDIMSEWIVGETVRRGDLPHVRLGGRVYIPANALDILFAQQQNEKLSADRERRH